MRRRRGRRTSRGLGLFGRVGRGKGLAAASTVVVPLSGGVVAPLAWSGRRPLVGPARAQERERLTQENHSFPSRLLQVSQLAARCRT